MIGDAISSPHALPTPPPSMRPALKRLKIGHVDSREVLGGEEPSSQSQYVVMLYAREVGTLGALPNPTSTIRPARKKLQLGYLEPRGVFRDEEPSSQSQYVVMPYTREDSLHIISESIRTLY
jgi:hypothetical protein